MNANLATVYTLAIKYLVDRFPYIFGGGVAPRGWHDIDEPSRALGLFCKDRLRDLLPSQRLSS